MNGPGRQAGCCRGQLFVFPVENRGVLWLRPSLQGAMFTGIVRMCVYEYVGAHEGNDTRERKREEQCHQSEKERKKAQIAVGMSARSWD